MILGNIHMAHTPADGLIDAAVPASSRSRRRRKGIAVRLPWIVPIAPVMIREDSRVYLTRILAPFDTKPRSTPLSLP